MCLAYDSSGVGHYDALDVVQSSESHNRLRSIEAPCSKRSCWGLSPRSQRESFTSLDQALEAPQEAASLPAASQARQKPAAVVGQEPEKPGNKAQARRPCLRTESVSALPQEAACRSSKPADCGAPGVQGTEAPPA